MMIIHWLKNKHSKPSHLTFCIYTLCLSDFASRLLDFDISTQYFVSREFPAEILVKYGPAVLRVTWYERYGFRPVLVTEMN